MGSWDGCWATAQVDHVEHRFGAAVAVSPGGHGPDLGVGALVTGVGDPVDPRVRDLVHPGPDRFREFHELGQPGPLRSGDPRVEKPYGRLL